MVRPFFRCTVGILIGACAAGTSRVSTSTATSGQAPPRRDIRELAIIPSVKTICPGQTIPARYEAILGDGSRVRIGANELSRLALRGIAAEAAPDGSWSTSANPLESVVSGFRLAVSLANDPGIHADTVIAPSYSCERLAIGLRVSDRYQETKAHVRLGVFPSPFYDSIVVAVIEPVGDSAIVLLLDPSRMRARAIQVSATGKPGVPGRRGDAGNDGTPCADGTNGSDGDQGEAGQAGGQVDVIVEAGARWLETLVGVTNSGGRGGPGGRGGLGGRPGARSNEPGCAPKPGRSGRDGRQGQDGPPGPYPKTTAVEASLLWHGSPIWFDSTARANLEQLMELRAKRPR